MGNRAIITTAPVKDSNVGIYVHWNGGQESVEGFLQAARELGIRDPQQDPDYALARLTQLIGNFFGGTLSLGVGKVGHLDAGDNGIWAVGADWSLIPSRHRYAARIVELGADDKAKAAGIAATCVEKFPAE